MFNFAKKHRTKSKKLLPARIMVLGFALVIFVGALLLTTPFATVSGKSVDFFDALFTSTSAVCVTGLVVFDTSTTWSVFGKLVIITLIQIGGLGFMSIATFFSLVVGKKINLKDRMLIKESMNQAQMSGLVRLIKSVLYATFGIEFVGAVLLSIAFVPRYGFVKGIGYGFFHSISAFCNAGFDLFGQYTGKFTSITGFYNSPLIVLTIGALIVLGGLGFPVTINIASRIRYKERVSVHSKIAIMSTIALIIFGTVVIFILESSRASTMGPMKFGDKVLSSLFQSITTRTAGFNTIDLTKLRESTLFFMIILMFIGANPASTGGGIKTVTIAVLFLEVRSVILDKQDITVFKRRLPKDTVRKALSILVIAATTVIVCTFILTAIEPNFSLLESAFEVTSAFATVGLSIGGTPNLSMIGKLFIIICMFMGRVGTLTVFMAFANKKFNGKHKLRFPETNVLVG